MNPRILALAMMLFALSSAGQICLSGILTASGPGCGCFSGCNLAPYGGSNCGSGVLGDCMGGYQLLTFPIPIPSDCELKVSAIMQPLPGCSASGGDAGGAGDRLKVQGAIAKPFQTGSANATLSDQVSQQGGTITVTAYANRADEIIQYTVEYISGNCPICNILMPIELLNFNVQWMDGAVLFDWTTLTETNNQWFVIEESEDLIYWKEIIRKEGAGTTTSSQTYNAAVVYKIGGIHYFRLRQIDYNGSTTIGPIVAVLIPQPATPYLAYYNNNHTLQVVIPLGGAYQYNLLVYSMDGQAIINTQGSLDDEFSIFFSPPEGMSIVILKTRSGEIVMREKIVW